MGIVVVVALWTLGLPCFVVADESEADLRETGRLLAILLDSGRIAIGRNQALLNDPSKGDKGFTPEVFAAQAMAVFKERTSHDLTDLSHANIPDIAKPLLEQLLAESKRTVASYQPVLNLQGLVYKGFIPATFGTETGMRFQKWSGIYLKQTAPDYLLRNPKNKPDPFEVAQMTRMSDPAYSRNGEAIVSETSDDGKSVRVLLPLFYEKACLSCHGQPKGERDITGYPREGGREGELGGAISVKMERSRIGVSQF
jgi:general secretion pathway protein A